MTLFEEFYAIYDTKLFFMLNQKEKNSSRTCRKRGRLPRAVILEQAKEFINYDTFIQMLRESKDQRKNITDEDKEVYEKYGILQMEPEEEKRGKEYWLWKAIMMGV